jgi:hypothetical protein
VTPVVRICLRLIPVVLLACLAGCDKTSDLPRLQDEALATAKIYQQRFDELAHRADALAPHAAALPAGAPRSAPAELAYRQAVDAIKERRNDLQQVPAAVQSASKSGDPEDLMKLIDGLRARSERSVTEVTTELSIYEGWIATAERWQGTPAAAPAEPAEPAAGSDPPVR